MAENNQGKGQHESREIRVFISSTFSDMREERKYLNAHVFPELRQLCEKRGAVFTEVDLQWGINEEDSKQGAAVEICLEEINRCHPYFIGMLGERYGWSPSDDGLTVRKDEEQETDCHIRISNDNLKPKVAKWNEAQESVTAMEIMHGVLENEKQQEFSYFYFRDKAFTQELFDVASAEDSAVKMEVFFEEEDSIKRKKLYELKERIRRKDGDWHVYEHKNDAGAIDTYSSVEELGNQIRDDLLKVINERFPEGEEYSALEKERKFHAAFASSRLEAYIPDEKIFEKINSHFSAEYPIPLVITGDTGSGKSALVSNYVTRWRSSNPEGFVIEHYAGTGGESDAEGVLLRVMSEIKEYFKIEDDLPKDTNEIYSKFAEWMLRIPKDAPYLVALDGVNQLRGKDGELKRFIHSFPTHGHLLMAMLPGETLDAARERKCAVENVEPLNEVDRRRLAEGYLARYKKDKGLGDLLDTLISHKHASNPLFLRVILDELRLDANHDTLKPMLDDYLSSQNLVNLFGKVLKRCESTYTKSHVKEVLTLIYAARYGLSEAELLDICHEESGHHVPQIYLASLVFGMGGYLAGREGLYGFMHDALRQAVEKKYALADKEGTLSIELNTARKEIVAYFQKLDEPTQRQVDELPWQLVHLDSKMQLQGYLAKLDVFLLFEKRNNGDIELFGYWNAAGCNQHKMLARYQTQFKDDDGHLRSTLGDFYNFCGFYREAESLHREALAIRRELLGEKDEDVASILHNLALVLRARGKHTEAEVLHREVLAIFRELPGEKHVDVASSLGALADTLLVQGKHTEAEVLHREALAILREFLSEKHVDVAANLTGLALVLHAQGKHSEAESLHREALAILRELLGEKHVDVARSLTGLALALHAQDKHSEAESLHREALAMSSELLGDKHEDVVRNQAALVRVLHAQNKHREAEAMNLKTLSMLRKLADEKSFPVRIAVIIILFFITLIRAGVLWWLVPLERMIRLNIRFIPAILVLLLILLGPILSAG
ncbi:tetratricopeptide repeat protein [Mariprofundus sp. KV]|uniref:tetratricopeptide repeat protein n=1 Tax=Mariprofundus sp. KV TaxID=2608715 RepID=UPI0015A01749|nr:tetratricopeptide repeat protein [Mariprofundus sp. KV]NWF36176.1 tetratricopeptide repeat protein [Mariprofundus sp. KV]